MAETGGDFAGPLGNMRTESLILVSLLGLVSAFFLVLYPIPSMVLLGFLTLCALLQNRVKFLLYVYLLTLFFIPPTIGVETPFLLFNVDRVVMAVLLGSWAILVFRGKVRLSATPVDKAVFIYLGVIIVTVAVNFREISRTHEWFTSVKTLFVIAIERVLIIYVMLSVFREKRGLQKLLWFIAVCLAIVAVYGIYESAVKDNFFVHISTIKNPEVNDIALSQTTRSGLYRAKSTQVLPHIFGTELCMIFPLIFFYLMDRGSKRKAAALLILAAFFGGIAVTYTRGVYLALFLGLALCFLRIKRVEKKIGLILAVVAVFSAGFAVPPVKAFYMRYMTKFLNPQAMTYNSDYSISTRLEDYAYAYKRLRNNYLFGEGYGTYHSGVQGDHYLDNAYLYVLIETGILGLAAFLWLVYTIVFRLARWIRSPAADEETEMLRFLHAGLIVFFFQCLTYDAFVFAGASKLFWVLLGTLLVYQKLRLQEAAA